MGDYKEDVEVQPCEGLNPWQGSFELFLYYLCDFFVPPCVMSFLENKILNQ